MSLHGVSRRVIRASILPTLTLAGLALGGAAYILRRDSLLGDRLWLATLLLTGGPVVIRTVRGMVAGRFASDIVATLAIVTAMILDQPLAGLIVVLMQTGGETLERYAEGRASAAVRALEADAPRVAHRRRDGQVDDIDVAVINVGDELIVRPGEMVPCDGVVIDGTSHLDTSRLTGEPIPIRVTVHDSVQSGTLNGEASFVLKATAISSQSLYARIVELVRSAEASKAPLQRLADRYAVVFTPLTLVICAVSWWASGDVLRVLSVLVVATPCPLILATPIAIIGGINRAASRQIIMRTGGALERLSRAETAIFDKTGTVTVGRPEVESVHAIPGVAVQDVLRLSAAVEQHSSHLLAHSVVDAARAEGIAIDEANAVEEAPGRGVHGHVGNARVAVGAASYIRDVIGVKDIDMIYAHEDPSVLRAYVTIDGRTVGNIDFADRLRPNVTEEIARLKRLGIRRTILLSGDRVSNARTVATAIGIETAEGDLLPHEKVERVAAMSRAGPVVMIGDGTNDAPALARADVGIALAGHGGGITAEAADIVILNDDLSRVSEAIVISRRAMRIARQSIGVGIGLSTVAMVAAAFGYVAPVVGALLQEAIDVAVIINALRAGAGRLTPD